MQALKPPLSYAESVSSRHLAKTVVVVLGESATRSHHSCYGYRLPTTPFIDSLADSTFIYTDVVASATSTEGNMERILSFKPDDLTYGDGLDYPLLVDVFKQAGYKVFWLSNQERTGTVSNTSGVMVMNADIIRYSGADNGDDALSSKFDEALIPYVDEALNDSSEYKLIFVHLVGSHANYYSRYPNEFEYFTADEELNLHHPTHNWLTSNMAQTIAEYDNSIRYTDYILSRFFEKFSADQSPGLFIYFSDHGENVYDDGPRVGRDETTVEIPFVVYTNAAYRAANDTIINQLKAALDKKNNHSQFCTPTVDPDGHRISVIRQRDRRLLARLR